MAIRASVGTAVERNRLRRRLRAIFSASELAGGHDVIVQATSQAAGKNFQELAEVVGLALDRAGVRSPR
jgi:ribonuclease P protein component